MAPIFFWAAFAGAVCPSLGSRAITRSHAAINEGDSAEWNSSRRWLPKLSDLPVDPSELWRQHAVIRGAASESVAHSGEAAGFLGVLRHAVARGGVATGAGLEKLGQGSGEAVLKDSNHFRNPLVWGPVTWFFIHDVAFAQEQEIPAEQQANLKAFFTEEMASILPCEECQARTRKIIKAMQPIPEDTWSNRTTLIYWVIMFHNNVNLDMEKPVVPVDRVLGHYVKNFDAGEPVSITFDPSEDPGVDPQTAFPKKWKAGGLETPEVIRFRMPKVWGPVGWFFLQSLALAQDDGHSPVHKDALVHFYINRAANVLPCPHCGMHLQGHLDSGRATLPTTNMNRFELAQWVNDLHNVVNREKKEPSAQFPWDKVVSGFNHQYSVGPPIDAYLGNGPLKTPAGHAESHVLKPGRGVRVDKSAAAPGLVWAPACAGALLAAAALA